MTDASPPADAVPGSAESLPNPETSTLPESAAGYDALEVVVIDPRGDLWLLAQGRDSLDSNKQVRFRVCSRTMARSSAVFDRMLFGGFAESASNNHRDNCGSDTGGDWEITLPDDASSPIRTLLLLMHGQCQDLAPVSVASVCFIKKVYDLTVMADKYDCMVLFRPYAAAWVQALAVNEQPESDLLRLSWIFYQLGCRSKYEEAVTRLIMNIPNEPANGSRPLPAVLPADLTETISNLRLRMLAQILRDLSTEIMMLQVGYASWGFTCARKDENSSECEIYMLGKAIRALYKERLYPIPSAENVHMSLRGLASVITKLAAACKGPKVLHGHANCSAIRLPGVPRPFWKESQSPKPEPYSEKYRYKLNDHEAKHIGKQAKLIGIEDLDPERLLDSCQVPFI